MHTLNPVLGMMLRLCYAYLAGEGSRSQTWFPRVRLIHYTLDMVTLLSPQTQETQLRNLE